MEDKIVTNANKNALDEIKKRLISLVWLPMLSEVLRPEIKFTAKYKDTLMYYEDPMISIRTQIYRTPVVIQQEVEESSKNSHERWTDNMSNDNLNIAVPKFNYRYNISRYHHPTNGYVIPYFISGIRIDRIGEIEVYMYQ